MLLRSSTLRRFVEDIAPIATKSEWSEGAWPGRGLAHETRDLDSNL